MVVIAIDHATERDVVFLKGGSIGRAPPVRYVGHDQHAKLVGPIQLARRFDLHVLTESGEADPPGAQNLIP